MSRSNASDYDDYSERDAIAASAQRDHDAEDIYASEPECLAAHCPPSMNVQCEWPKCVNPNIIT